MTQPHPAIDRYLAEFARIQSALPGAGVAWLSQRRREALDRLVAAGLPHSGQEDWKYTDVKPVGKRAFEAETQAPALQSLPAEAGVVEDLEAHRLVFVNGHFSAALSDIGRLPDGAMLQPLSAVLQSPPPAVEERLGAALAADQASGFSELNSAFMSDGVYLQLADGVALDRPVYAVCLACPGERQPMANLRHLVLLGDNAEAQLIEHYTALPGEAYLTNTVTEIFAERGAQLHRCRLQQEADNGYHIGSVHAAQARDSRIGFHNVDLGARLARSDTDSRLQDTGAEASIYGLYLPDGRRHIDNHTRIDHLHPQGRSREVYKGVLTGRGRGVFNGKIIVHRDAQKTDSEQSSAALLLSANAEVDAKPELEIYADDVKCAHGSTVGQLDEDAVFYLRSRGVDLDTARALLTYSFAEEVIQTIASPALRRHVESGLLRRLPNGQQIQELL